MSGASVNTQGGFLGFFVEYGPLILLVSVALVTIGLALSRPWTAVSSLAAGAVPYLGMYAQASYFAMYASLALGSPRGRLFTAGRFLASSHLQEGGELSSVAVRRACSPVGVVNRLALFSFMIQDGAPP